MQVGVHHDHSGHSHSHADVRESDRRRLVGAIVVTAVILVAEVVGGIVSHSLALLSDAGHMLSDVVAQGLSLAALAIAARPSDARRTYGWHRVEILAALANGVTLVALSLFLMWEGWQRLHAPVIVQTHIMMTIAGIGLVANVAGAWFLHGSHSLNVKSAYLHVLGDALSSLAVLGGGAVMYFTQGLYWLDPALSMAIGALIMWSSYALIRDAVDVLLETVPRNIDLAGVTHAIDGMEHVVAVHDLHIWTITSGLHALSAHIVVRGLDAGARDGFIKRLTETLSERFKITHTTVQLESEAYDHACHVC
jgi:cobalt-zinc-cadmium efflux system protein